MAPSTKIDGDFFNLSLSDLKSILTEEYDQPAFRAVQIFEWVYQRGEADFKNMTNLSVELREQLHARFAFPEAQIRERRISSDGTRKYLLEVENGDLVESVMIKQPTRMTLCISSQVGCGMGCEFCRTATMGFRRNLSMSEILRQVRAVIKDAQNFGDSFSNIVFMGMGEPLHNIKSVTRAIEILTHQKAFSIAPRRITVSTVGLVPAIKKFGETNLKVNLAVSLNATTDEIRSRIMPINKNYPLEELLGCLREFPLKPKAKITIEYVMLAGVNDSMEDLARLPKVLKGIPSKVNLIPYNENAGLGFKTPDRGTIMHWHNYLNDRGMQATIRWSKGVDIQAACGQLATESVKASRALQQVA